MNKIDLEKIIDKNFCIERYCANWPFLEEKEIDISDVKQFIFETIIPEVLNSIIDRPFLSEADDLYREWYDDCISDIKQKAKKLYNINL